LTIFGDQLFAFPAAISLIHLDFSRVKGARKKEEKRKEGGGEVYSAMVSQSSLRNSLFSI